MLINDFPLYKSPKFIPTHHSHSRKMVLVTELCSQILKCRVADLRDLLNHPINRTKVMKSLSGKQIQTTYDDRNGMRKSFFVGGLSQKGANVLMAFGKMPRPFNISVTAYFYSRHRIRLQNPFLHCIIEKFPNGEDRHYPLELLEICEEKAQIWLGNMFKEMSENSEHDDEVQEGRDELSQYCGWWKKWKIIIHTLVKVNFQFEIFIKRRHFPTH